MRNFFQNLGYKLSKWMYGRNGMDSLNQFLIITVLVLNLLSYFPYLRILYFLGSGLLVWAVFRFCSKNLYKRQQENMKFSGFWQKFLKVFETYKKMWQDRSTHKYFKCKCGTRLRVPKGKGKIEITCPNCKSKIIKKT